MAIRRHGGIPQHGAANKRRLAYARGQAALDFLISYGFVILVIGVAIAVLIVFQLNGTYTETDYCNPSPGFSCGYYFINTSGEFSVQIAQVSGASMVINGIACSTEINATGNGPEYGNVRVNGSASFYPPGGMGSGTLYSGKAQTFNMYCYRSGGTNKGLYGNGAAGYVWMNYTLPGYKSEVIMIASFNTKYT